MNEKFFLKLLELSAAHAKRKPGHFLKGLIFQMHSQKFCIYSERQTDTPRKNLPLSAE